jgi:hypothetical protein
MIKNTGNTFMDLSSIDVTAHLEYKNGLSYLQWMACHSIVKLYDPKATYVIHRNEQGLPYFVSDAGAFVITEMTINGETQMEELPVLDYKNKSIQGDKLNSFDINTAIKRCLVKNAALFGLGAQVYINGEGSPLDLNKGLGKKAPSSTPKTAKSASLF